MGREQLLGVGRGPLVQKKKVSSGRNGAVFVVHVREAKQYVCIF